MVEGGIGRFVRIVLGFAIAKLLLLPALAMVPGLKEFLSNPELTTWISGLLTATLASLVKKSRNKGWLPRWLPL